MRRTLVTGATGGLGRELVMALLDKGDQVRATGRNLAVGVALQKAGAAFVAAELTDPGSFEKLVEGRDVVFHAAALSRPWGRLETFQAINIDATRHLVSAARAAGCDGFVFISTPSVYAEPRDRLNVTENSPLPARFANAYAATKREAEKIVLAANEQGFATMILRPRAIIGPDDTVLLPRLIRIARTGKFPLFRGGQALIELTDRRDVVEAAIAADRARAVLGGRVFNISSGAPATVKDTLTEIFGALGLRPRLIPVPYGAAAMACAAAEWINARRPGYPEPPATVYSISTLAFSLTFDLAAAHRDLSWHPRFSPQQAIARTADSWSHHAPV